MILFTQSNDDYQAFCQLLVNANDDPRVQSALLFLPEGNAWSEQQINEAIKLFNKPLLGGVFPQIIHQKQCHTSGAIVVGLAQRLTVHSVAMGEGTEAQLISALEANYPDHYQNDTLLLFTDGLSSGCSLLIDQLFNHFGLEINFIGGGAGSLSLVQQPCVISSNGLQQGVAVMALLQQPTGIGVAHGWTPITEAYRVTEASGNRIISLNWQPAFEVYQQVIAEHSQQQITADNFFDIAKAYPFGITKLNAELVVRDPIVTEHGQLVCVGDVPQGSFVHILSGDVHSLPQAATEARQRALHSLPHKGPLSYQLFIDCISRVLFLEQHFKQELDNVIMHKTPMIGALTLGEIANNGQDYLEFYNKTAVVAFFQEG